MACIRKRRDKWVLDFRDQSGRRRWETVNGSKRDAELLLAERLQQIGRHEYLSRREEKTFGELASAYQTDHIETNVRYSTRKDYEGLLNLHLLPYLDPIKLRAITDEVVSAWRAKLLENKLGRRTINKAHTLLSAMLRYAVRKRWLTYNVAADVPKLRDESSDEDKLLDENILTPVEVPSLLDSADDSWRPHIHFAVSTGLRQGEELGLKWGDIDWQAKQLYVRRQFSKGRFSQLKTKHSRRRVGLSEELMAELKKWKLRCPKSEHDLVFPGDDGRPLNHGILLRNGFYPALRRAKLRHIRWHDLRHTFASLLIAQNVHPKRIQALLGHSSIRVTMDIYGHLMHDADNAAAEKVASLISRNKNDQSGSKVVAALGAKESQVLEKMEAGVGIEPAYTDLQSAA